jgi:uncharacterized protein (DUF1015 family)
VTDNSTIETLVTRFAKEKFFIADGHHRYETSLAYRDELGGGKALPAEHPANFVMMCAVPFDDPGLVIMPTHRMLELGGIEPAVKGLEALGEDYDIRDAGALEELNSVCSVPCETIAIYAGGRAYLLQMKPATRKALAAKAGELMADLNVFQVLERVLPRFFGDVQRAIDQERIKYSHDLAETLKRIDSNECQAAIILSPITVRQMATVASAGKTMPPKSTYFYPKLPTGVVMKPLE